MRPKLIPVPAAAVRTREAILVGAVVREDQSGTPMVWVPCWHCGGSGNYPSSMIPAGRCYLYCWSGRDAETYGKLPVHVDKYVKRQQAHDRAAYRDRVRRDALKTEPRALALAAAFGWNLDQLPVNIVMPTQDEEFARSLLRQYMRKGALSEKQWYWVKELTARREEKPTREQRIIDNGYEAYAREEGHYDGPDY